MADMKVLDGALAATGTALDGLAGPIDDARAARIAGSASADHVTASNAHVDHDRLVGERNRLLRVEAALKEARFVAAVADDVAELHAIAARVHVCGAHLLDEHPDLSPGSKMLIVDLAGFADPGSPFSRLWPETLTAAETVAVDARAAK